MSEVAVVIVFSMPTLLMVLAVVRWLLASNDSGAEVETRLPFPLFLWSNPVAASKIMLGAIVVYAVTLFLVAAMTS